MTPSTALDLIAVHVRNFSRAVIADESRILTRHGSGSTDVFTSAASDPWEKPWYASVHITIQGAIEEKWVYAFADSPMEAARAVLRQLGVGPTSEELELAMHNATDAGVFDGLLDDAERYESATL